MLVGIEDHCFSLFLEKAFLHPLSANPTKWSNTLRRQQPTIFLSAFDHFVGLALKGLRQVFYTKTHVLNPTRTNFPLYFHCCRYSETGLFVSTSNLFKVTFEKAAQLGSVNQKSVRKMVIMLRNMLFLVSCSRFYSRAAFTDLYRFN